MRTSELIKFLIEKEFINYNEDHEVIDKIVEILRIFEQIRETIINREWRF